VVVRAPSGKGPFMNKDGWYQNKGSCKMNGQSTNCKCTHNCGTSSGNQSASMSISNCSCQTMPYIKSNPGVFEGEQEFGTQFSHKGNENSNAALHYSALITGKITISPYRDNYHPNPTSISYRLRLWEVNGNSWHEAAYVSGEHVSAVDKLNASLNGVFNFTAKPDYTYYLFLDLWMNGDLWNGSCIDGKIKSGYVTFNDN